jgi:hypothetical protein
MLLPVLQKQKNVKIVSHAVFYLLNKRGIFSKKAVESYLLCVQTNNTGVYK